MKLNSWGADFQLEPKINIWAMKSQSRISKVIQKQRSQKTLAAKPLATKPIQLRSLNSVATQLQLKTLKTESSCEELSEPAE